MECSKFLLKIVKRISMWMWMLNINKYLNGFHSRNCEILWIIDWILCSEWRIKHLCLCKSLNHILFLINPPMCKFQPKVLMPVKNTPFCDVQKCAIFFCLFLGLCPDKKGQGAHNTQIKCFVNFGGFFSLFVALILFDQRLWNWLKKKTYIHILHVSQSYQISIFKKKTKMKEPIK